MKIIYVFLHEPKTAGTAVVSALSSSLTNNQRILLYPDSGASRGPRTRMFPQSANFSSAQIHKYLLSLSLEQKSKIRLVAGHFAYYGIHDYFPNQNIKYIYILRDPFLKQVSLYNAALTQFYKYQILNPGLSKEYITNNKHVDGFKYWVKYRGNSSPIKSFLLEDNVRGIRKLDRIDYLIDYSNLKEDLLSVCKDLKGDFNIPIINSTDKNAENFRFDSLKHSEIKHLKKEVIEVIKTENELYEYGMKQREKNIKRTETRIALIVHVYYWDVWLTIASKIRRIKFEFDLYVTVSDKSITIDDIKKDFPESKVIKVENKGYDIGPLFQILDHVDLLDYDFICKLHTKKGDDYSNGIKWGEQLVDCCIGSSEQVEKVLRIFEEEPMVGMVGCESYIDRESIGANYDNYLNCGKKLSIAPEYLRELEFVAGTMFWARPEIFIDLARLELNIKDFKKPVKNDGELPHAIERVFGAINRNLGYRIEGVNYDACEPLVSILMPSYNYGWSIEEAIESVLSQKYQNWELIVVDDCSHDDSVLIVQKYQIKHPEKLKLFCNIENQGLTKTYERALSESQGEFIAFLECDDVWDCRFLESKMRVFLDHQSVVAVFNDVEMFGDQDLIDNRKEYYENVIESVSLRNQPFDAKKLLLEKNIVLTFSSIVVRRNSIDLSVFNSDFGPWFDWYFWGVISNSGSFYFDDAQLTRWRTHKMSYDVVHGQKNTEEEIDGKKKDIISALLQQNVSASKVIAFYLPQFHPIKENNEWWGEGFTEWTNVASATPLYDGHQQPKIPKDLGFYDLRLKEVQERQAAMAKMYGISGFCYYHYWFEKGRKLLSDPIESMLKNKNINIDFCICWANEPWTRAWDGLQRDVLIDQKYGNKSEWRQHFDYLLTFFKDGRYIRVDNKPMLLIYRIGHIPEINKMLNYWRELALENGLNGLHIVGAYSNSFNDDNDFYSYDIDAIYEFAPNCCQVENYQKGGVSHIDYSRIWEEVITLPKIYKTQYLGGFVSWDNTPRRGKNGLVIENSSPKLFQKYLKYQIDRSAKRGGIVFLNAWNEWAEGCYLEPDQKNGSKWLEAVSRARSIEENPSEELLKLNKGWLFEKIRELHSDVILGIRLLKREGLRSFTRRTYYYILGIKIPK